jgi:hypothetical protein
MSAVLKKDLFAQGAAVSPNSGTPALAGNDTSRLTGVDAVPVPVSAGSRILDRTQEMVVQHAMRTTSLTSESLQVVIKPGEGTQLSLELRQRGDGVEVQAVLQQGDFNHLKQSWSDLQQQLQQRGIQLGSLANGNNLAGNGNAYLKENQKGLAGSLEDDSTAVSVAGQSVLASGASVGNIAIFNGKSGWQMWA